MAMKQSEVERLATVVAKKMKAVVWWADFDDLTQCAQLAAAEAARTWDARVGVPEGPYVYNAMQKAVYRATCHASTPATGGTSHRPEVVKGLRRAPLEVQPGGYAPERYEAKVSRAAAEHVHGVEPVAVDDLYADADWLARVQARLTEVAKSVGPGGANALRVILGDATAAEVAEVRGVVPATVHAQSSALRKAISSDEVLYELIVERREE